MLLTHTLLSSAKFLVIQGITKGASISEKASNQCFKNNNVSKLPTSGKVTPIAEGILQSIKDQCNSFERRCVAYKILKLGKKKLL